MGGKMKTLKDLLTFLMQNKRWWLLPIVIVLLLLSLVIVFTETSAIAPFIYALF